MRSLYSQYLRRLLAALCRYYEGGVSSVYLWDLDDGGFAGVVLLKKSELVSFSNIHTPHITGPTKAQTLSEHLLQAMTPTSRYEPSGSWDSIHVFETAERGRQAHYKLTSTIMLQLITRSGNDAEAENPATTTTGGEKRPVDDGWKREGEISLSGSMTRQARPRRVVPHLV
jgi:capping protein beta